MRKRRRPISTRSPGRPWRLFPDATPLRGIAVKAAAQGSPLRFPDTMSARYHINDISALLRGKKVAIIGLGGTGAYILDFIARTHLEQIALFDDDKVHVHTIFRVPGFIPRRYRGAQGRRAGAAVWAMARRDRRRYPNASRSENIERLAEFDFVFVSVDDGPARLLIVDWLSARGIPYVDCGMGLNRSTGRPQRLCSHHRHRSQGLRDQRQFRLSTDRERQGGRIPQAGSDYRAQRVQRHHGRHQVQAALPAS